MKTSDLTGPALDWAAEKALCTPWSPNGYFCYDPPHSELGWFSSKPRHSYSTDWSQGGPIIERERINLEPFKDINGEQWSVDGEWNSPTPLIAAMRCFVASKLGDEVDIPKELL